MDSLEEKSCLGGSQEHRSKTRFGVLLKALPCCFTLRTIMAWLPGFCSNIFIDKETKIYCIHNLSFQIHKYGYHKHTS